MRKVRDFRRVDCVLLGQNVAIEIHFRDNHLRNTWFGVYLKE